MIEFASDTSGHTPLSACIIAFNEERRIGECLASLAFCDEIVVVDSGSSDRTRVLCEAAGARVLQREFDGFRSQKQFAVDQATHRHVLCLDADERVSDELRAAILAERARGFPAAGYRFARLSFYFGRFLRHGNAYPDMVMRLFDRERGGWRGEREVHEAASVDGAVVTLRGNIVHFPYESLQQQLHKTERYARMMADYAFAHGERATLWGLIVAPAWRFVRGYVVRGGFLDGWHGLVYAYVRANYVRQKTVILWLLQNGQRIDNRTGASERPGAE